MDKLDVDNDIRVIIKSKNDGILFDQECCTCINIILNNDGEVATSFLGVHNEKLIKTLCKIQKAYFKALKKTLKEERLATASDIDAKENESKANCPKDDTCNCEQNVDNDSNPVKESCQCNQNIDKKSNKTKTSKKSCDCDAKNSTTGIVDAKGENCRHILDKSGKKIAKAKLDK